MLDLIKDNTYYKYYFQGILKMDRQTFALLKYQTFRKFSVLKWKDNY